MSFPGTYGQKAHRTYHTCRLERYIYVNLTNRGLGKAPAPQILVPSPYNKTKYWTLIFFGFGVYKVWEGAHKEPWNCFQRGGNSVRLVGKRRGRRESRAVRTGQHCSLLATVPPTSLVEEHRRPSPLSSVSNAFGLLPASTSSTPLLLPASHLPGMLQDSIDQCLQNAPKNDPVAKSLSHLA